MMTRNQGLDTESGALKFDSNLEDSEVVNPSVNLITFSVRFEVCGRLNSFRGNYSTLRRSCWIKFATTQGPKLNTDQ